MKNIKDLFLEPAGTFLQAARILNQTARGIVLIVDQQVRLIGTITDGDIRRALLEGLPLESPVSTALRNKSEPYTTPLTAPVGSSPEILVQQMRESYVQQMPLLNEEGVVVDLVTMRDLLPTDDVEMQAVIMAGGYGSRLRPLTLDTPKPMLSVGDRPLLEHTIDQLRQSGIRRINVTTHYLSERIVSHFGDGANFGVELSYVSENTPLGTAGALGLMDKPTEPILVLNGDLLTRINFRAMLEFHREQKAAMTMAVRNFNFQIPYGVVEFEGTQVIRVNEKPNLNLTVNAGVYLLEPFVFQYIQKGQRSDMPDLIQTLLTAKQPVSSFPIYEYWLDIGKHDDYLRAQTDMKHGKTDL